MSAEIKTGGSVYGIIEEGGEIHLLGVRLRLQSGSKITITGCGEPTAYTLEGEELCPSEKLEEMKIVHKLECKPEGSEVFKIGKEPVNFTDTEKLRLASEAYWAAE